MIIIYAYERDVAEYTGQGWICWRLEAHHGQRKNGKNFICVRYP